ncbi:MAG: helix-turn-helix transcriptional regulator [Aquabacterium sp.]
MAEFLEIKFASKPTTVDIIYIVAIVLAMHSTRATVSASCCTLGAMPNIANVLKEEIARVARKEMREELNQMRKVLTAHRSDIAELKRKNKELEQHIRRLQKASAASAGQPAASTEADQTEKHRFSSKGLAKQRQRLGLSAADFGLLVGASGQSIYKWEDGSVRPRARQIEAIAAIRGIGKREAIARLETLKGSGGSEAAPAAA